jgi:hypothetical protein
MIDFASITQTLDGYACHYFGQRNVFISGGTWRVHCFAVFHPEMGVFEKWYDDEGHKLSIDNHRVARTNNKKYRIVETNNAN